MEQNKNNTNINWYPGHMAKTRRQIEQDLKIVDIVIELLDARIPKSSQNPDIGNITKGKKKIIVLNKCDLADEKKNQQWVQYFEKKGTPAVLTDSNSGKGIDQCIRKIEEIMSDDLQNQVSKGRIGRKIRAMILRNSQCWQIIVHQSNFQENHSRSRKQARGNQTKAMDTHQ